MGKANISPSTSRILLECKNKIMRCARILWNFPQMAKIGVVGRSSQPLRDEKCFINPFSIPSYTDLALADLHVKLKETIASNLQSLQARVGDGRNQSVYTGEAGIALLFIHAAHCVHHSTSISRKQHLETALLTLQPCLTDLNTRRSTFLCGAGGPLALGAYLHHLIGDPSKSKECVCKLRELCPGPDSLDLPQELLYGHAGYLYALLFVGRLVPGARDDSLIEQQVLSILDVGQKGSTEDASLAPLMFTWHSKHYLGAAHGLAGILTVLLQVEVEHIRPRILSVVQPCVDYLISQQFPSGNFPSSLESADRDRLVQWCHGAPGLVHLLARAYKVYNKKSYLEAALRCGEVVWQRGLLLKGYSLCHGVAGNACSFLQLYRLTGDRVQLYRALKFAEWCLSSQDRQCCTPDHPNSLFEGLAGIAHFYCSLLVPEKATFPALELPTPY